MQFVIIYFTNNNKNFFKEIHELLHLFYIFISMVTKCINVYEYQLIYNLGIVYWEFKINNIKI